MTDTILDTAVAASKAGICVVPVKEDGSKQPDLPAWTQFQERLPSKVELTDWFVRQERTGLGFICGKVSGGLELLEFDDPDAYHAFKAACVEEGLWPVLKTLEAGYFETTPGGGVHLLYRTPAPLKNTKLAVKPCPGAPVCTKHAAGKPHVLAETRGEGGFVVVAPSHGAVHATGGEYVQRGNGVAALPELDTDTRDHLFLVAQSLDQMPRPSAEPQPRIRSEASGERPGDDFNARADWMEDVLGPHGWKVVKRYGGLTYVRRPGKSDSHSATFGPRGDGDYLYVFSSSTEFDTERGYSKFAAYTLLNYGASDADFATAARELRTQGYGGAYGDVSDLLAGGGSQLESEASAGERGDTPPLASSTDVPDEPKAVSFRSADYRFESAFPPGHFVARYVEYASQLTDAAHEYHEALGVALLSACTPGLRARLSAWPNGLATNLYMVMVGSSTRSRKSTAIGRMKAILDQVDDTAVFPDRFSTEAMLEQLAMRPRRPAIWFPDEWGQVLENMPRQPLLEDALLRLYDSPRAYDYARHSKRIKGGDKVDDHDRVVDPHWSIVGATTEAVFDAISSRAIQSGFLPRFAYIYPEHLPARMPLRANAPAAVDLERELVGYLRNLYSWSSIVYDTAVVRFTEDALAAVDDFMIEVEESGDTMLARLPPMALKVAMLCAVGREVPSNTILDVGIEDARVGVAMARRWGEFAQRFAADIGGFDALERRFQGRCDKALAFVRFTGKRSRQELMRELRVSAEELDRIQRTLLERGVIVLKQGESAGGRPPLFWEAASIADGGARINGGSK